MEITRAEIDAVFDTHGRFVLTPDPIKLDGQKNIPCDLQEGESLLAFLRRHVPGIESGAWAVRIGSIEIPRAMWAKTFPKHGMLIACRATVGKQVVQLVAIAALSYFTLGAGAAAIFGTTLAGQALALGVFVAGSVLINKVLGPKVPKTAEAAAARNIYSLSGQRNSARQYEPIPVLWGEMRVTPDLASQPYAWFEGDDQYLSTILLGGINVHSASDLAIGDTPIGSYQGVDVYYNGFPGMASQGVPLYSNADTTAGGELPDTTGWVTRTTSDDVVAIGVDYEMQLYLQGNAGLKHGVVNIETFYRAVGTEQWLGLINNDGPGKWGVSNNTTEIKRYSFTKSVPKGRYEVRTRRVTGAQEKLTCNVTWVSLRSIQADLTDYTGWGRIGIKIKATGQISGSLDTLRATYRAKPMPIWNGVAWATATTRETGLSNPGAIILLALRGIWHKGKLQFGFGLTDDQIDIEGLKAFMLHCTAKGYTYDKWITSSMSLQEFCQEVALAGMGEFSWTDGSRPTVVFVSAGQPISAVVNMANMLKASFSVDYALSNAADGIEYQWLNRDTWEMTTLRVMAPGVTTMLNPARVSGEGVTSEAHAAVMARYHLAQSLYQFKTIGYSADIEHLDYRRLSMVSVSHDLTQWGFGGRLMAAEVVGGKVRLTLDEPVPPLANAHLGLRVPGARDYRVWPVVLLAAESNVVELVGEWPAGVAFPGGTLDNPAHDTLWCYDFKATPGYRVRVTSMEPEGDLKGAKITCVPEGPEFWDYVLNGNYVPAPNHSALPQRARPTAKRLRVVEEVHLQGNTEWYELHLMWETSGEVDYCQVWAGLDGSELRLVDARATQNRASVRIDAGGQWLLRVVPFDAGGVAGTAANLLYGTEWVNRAPAGPRDFVVLPIEGGLRRYAWQWGETGKPATVAGVQIRHLEGTSATVEDWEGMTPLGEASDIYTAQFESSKPDAGMYTFGLRSITTAGVLSSSMLAFTINLPDSLGEMAEIDYTPPPAPENLHAEGLFATVQVSWDAPVYPQGGGHKVTEVFAGLTESIGQAKKVADAFGGPVSFEAELGGTVYVWARFVTQADVPGPFAGPVSAQTAEDVEKLLDVLDGQITESQLYADLSKRIDAIDVGSPELGKSLLESAASLETAQQQVRHGIDDMAQGLLEAALAADAALERITDAGVYVDPVTGTVKIYGLEQTNEHVTTLQILLDAVQGQMLLKASTAYVDGKIAEAVLSPADLLLYEGIDARLITVTQELDSINGRLTQKADALELQGALVRLTTAESNLDALGGQIALRVTRAEYQADQDALQQRMGSAELTLSALDVPAITATVIASRRNERDAEKTAEALLRDILSGERNREQAADALAFARNQLSSAITDGLAAEAQQRLELAAVVGAQGAALTQESKVRADAVSAEALARQLLAAETQRGQQSLSAQIAQEASTRASAVEAEASQRLQLQSVVEGNHDAAMQAAQSASDAAGGKGKVIFGSSQPAAADRLPQNLWIDTAGGANTPKRWSGTTWIVVTDKAATDAAAAAAAAQTKADQASAAILQESQTRATAIEAEAAQRQQLQATVGSNHTAAMQAAQAASDAAGSKGKVLYGTSAPAVADRLAQNLWIDTTGGANTPKRWNGSAWAAVTDKAATDAAAAAATAQSTANNAVAAIQAEQSVRANETGYLGAQYTVRMQLGQGGQQVVGGFGLSGTSSQTAGARIDFGVMANSFWIAAPAGSPAGVSNVKPFSVQTTAQTINGVVVPAGVYMDAAYINNVTVLFGRFGTLLADKIRATAISASQLTAGNGVIGGSLKSSNYVAGSSGWLLRPDGMAEFSGVIVRGSVYATAGQIGGWNITTDRIRSAGFTSNDGVELRSDGRMYARNAATNVLFNLAATGTGEVLRVGNALVINAQGDAIFGGTLSARVVRTDNIISDAIVRSWAGTTPGPIAVGGAASGGSWKGAHVAVSATPGRPLIINASVTYDMADNWYASQYGQRDQRFYLSVYCDRFDANGAWNSRVELFGVESGRAIRLETAVIAYGIGLATSTFRAIAPSVVAGGYNVYYAEVRCAGIGFVVRHGSLVVQEQRV